MKYRKTVGGVTFNIFNTLIMILFAVVCLLPVWHTLCSSFSMPYDLGRSSGLVIWPVGGFTTQGYELVLQNKGVWTGYLNTIINVTIGTFLGVLLTYIAAYVLSRKNLLFGSFLTLLIMFTMWFDGGLIPRYMVVRKLGMLDTRAALILPTVMSTFNFIIMRTALSEVPDGLVESATIDGANHLTIMFRIIMPVTKATLAVIALYYAVGIWNSWFSASIYLSKNRSLRPLQLVLRDILINADTSSINVPSDASSATDMFKPLVQYTTIVIATAPILAIYPFVQKYFVAGVMLGSIKG